MIDGVSEDFDPAPRSADAALGLALDRLVLPFCFLRLSLVSLQGNGLIYASFCLLVNRAGLGFS